VIRLPRFDFHAPRTITEAAALLADAPAETMLLAGGTDVVPKMKRRQQGPRRLVALRQVAGLGTILHRDGELVIGACATLSSLVHDARLRESVHGLWQAAAQVATPHLRNMGTIGGNLCLDTRCTYYDQSQEWRKSINFCMKKDGDICWVATSSPRCLAVSSTDTAPMLLALGARVRLVSTQGERVIAASDLYRNDGIEYLSRRTDEILADVQIPEPGQWRSCYWKLRRRGSFDFPVASVAAAVRLDGDRVVESRIVLGAVASRPLVSEKAARLLAGQLLTDDVIAAAADGAYEIAKPMDNTDFELIWRKRMVRALTTYALRELRGDDVRELRLRIARQDLIAVS